jgi:carboxymethylenebutenolidase
MQERETVIRTRAGQMTTFIAHPEGDGPFPPVIFYMDAPGYRDELKDMARRIANAGYYCVLPDLYYRVGHIRLAYDRSQESHVRIMMAIRNSLTNQMVVDDTGSILAHLDASDRVRPGSVGAVGHCMSGSYIVTVPAVFPNRFAAAAAFYGTRIITDEADSPHLIVNRIRAEMYLSFAEVDTHVEPDTAAAIQKLFAEHGVKHDVETVAGT